MSVYKDLIKFLSTDLDTKLLHKIDTLGLNSSITFQELKNPKETKLKKLTITGFTDVVALNQDHITSFKPALFPKEKGISKSCDGIVFCLVNEEPHIIVFDMKSSLSNISEHIWKTKCGRNFLSYLKCVLEQFFDKNLNDWSICYCIFHTGDPKRTTGTEPEVSKDPKNPVHHCVNDGDTVHVNKILGKKLL